MAKLTPDIRPDFKRKLTDQMYIAEPYATELFGPATERQCPGCQEVMPIELSYAHEQACYQYQQWKKQWKKENE